MVYNIYEVIILDGRKGSNLRELVRILVRNLGILERDGATCCGATITQCHAIVELGRAEEISLNELAELLNLDKSTMSRTVNSLVEQNLAVRDIHPDDRRYVKIALTEEGRRVYKTTEEGMEIYYESILNSIPQDKREQVMESLQLLVDAVKANKCC